VKILAINGSYRGEKGYTAFLLDKLRQGVAGAGGEWETVVLAGQKINRCLSCGTCNRADHYLRCVFVEEGTETRRGVQGLRADGMQSVRARLLDGPPG